MKRGVRTQRTILRPVRLAGIGYWSSQDVLVEFRPALPHSGVTFVRCDVTPVCRIRARVDNRIDTPRRTTLARQKHVVEMVEHILAALAGLRIDNCEVWVNAPEMPAWDGSSDAATCALLDAGVATQEVSRDLLVIDRPLRVGDDQAWILAEPHAEPGLHLRYELDFGPECPIAPQAFELTVNPESFRREIAPARTFVLEAEAECMRAHGLGARITYRDLLVFGTEGPIENDVRFPEEC
ncbi:MAG TPA: UDP-3-O-acyl-N-acetylglucosamine deacetylase, partial [Pirellulaceae bacterium]